MNLRDELLNDPLNIGYLAMSDDECAASLNDPIRQVIGQATRTDFIRWAARHDSLNKLESDTGATKSISRAVLFMMQTDGVIDFTDPEIVAMMDALVTAGVFTQTEKDDLMALATKTVSRAQELGLPKVKTYHVTEARA